jgi:AcrR family transcriptional regulator
MGATTGSEPPTDFDLIWVRPHRGAGAKRPALSRDQVVRAAIEFADEEGLEAMSMRRIAARLGAGTTSLYWHVPSKDALYELMFDAVMGEIDLPERLTDNWREDLRALARSDHVLFQRHPWLILLGIQPGIGPNTQRYADFGVRILETSLHLQEEDGVNALAVVNNYVFGFAYRETAWDQLRRRSGFTDKQWQERLGRYLAQAKKQDAALARALEARLRLVGDDSFEFGLDCVLEGIAARFGLDRTRKGRKAEPPPG